MRRARALYRRWSVNSSSLVLLVAVGGAFIISLLILHSTPLDDAVVVPDGGANKIHPEPILRRISQKDKEEYREEEQEQEYGKNDIVAEDQAEDDDAYDEYEEDNDNPVFRAGDFDVAPSLMQLSYSTSNAYEDEGSFVENVDDDNNEPETEKNKLQNSKTPVDIVKETDPAKLLGIDGRTIVEDGMFWSSEVEKEAPKGFSDSYVAQFRTRVREMRVVDVQPPSWDRCGRPKNQFITLSDGSQMCARYRSPHDYLIQGEVMSFYLARLLGIGNVPIVVLSQVDRGQWASAGVQKQLKIAGWLGNATVALIQWIKDLDRDRMPPLLLNALRTQRNVTVTTEELTVMMSAELSELLQWSDLIVFDYITGNYDRVASMQDAAEKEEKPSILMETVHNLAKSRNTQGLWFIDNESGLLDAYSLLYTPTQLQQQSQSGRFLSFHRDVLSTMCVFRRSTYERVKWLRDQSDPLKLLVDAILREDPLFASLRDISINKELGLHFRDRIDDVYRHMQTCLSNSSSLGT